MADESEKMFSFKHVIVFVILHVKLSHSIDWIPISSPKILQNYLGRELQIMKPPYVIREFRPSLDFTKSKTQIFYKATLPVHQSPVYEFRYKIHDPKEENYQEKSEVRVGDSVKGYYSVREPNGYIRLVKYVSDENGFQTQVSHHHVDDNYGGGYSFDVPRHIT